MNSKPVIGIILPVSNVPSSLTKGYTKSLILTNSYVSWMIEMNCIPFFITTTIDLKDISFLVEKIDGLFFPGGQDIDPGIYGEKLKTEYTEKTPVVGGIFHRQKFLEPNLERDKIEIKLYHLAKKNKIPILGVCRGIQLINVAEGGSLQQEIKETSVQHYPGNDGLIPYHEIVIDKSTQCYKLMGVDKYFSSSIHHQVINQLGDDLIVSARSQDGIIEIIENKRIENFIFGIQGHPEITRKNLPLFDKIFLKFVDAAKKKIKRK